MKNKKTIIVLSILTIIFTIIGGSLAYYNWQTSESQKTNIVFTVEGNFSCAADGGGDITSSDVMLAPASCTNSKYAIKREVTVTPKILGNGLNIDMDLWLDINDLGDGLSKSKNFKYALTTESDSCTEGVVVEGTFEGKTKEDKIYLLKEKTYNQTTSDKYYLYIWLDEAETSTDTMNQTLNFSLNGTCVEGDSFDDHTPMITSYSCANETVGDTPYFTYTGDCTTIDDGDGNWRIKFLTDGEFTSTLNILIDAFLVGGGGGGASNIGGSMYGNSGGGGGGGYTSNTVTQLIANQTYEITIGEGGAENVNGGDTIAFGSYAHGGFTGFQTVAGGAGGSCGGGGAGVGNTNGCEDGKSGTDNSGTSQGTSTREFGESTGTLYSGGGGGGGGDGYSGGKGGAGGGADGGISYSSNGANADNNTGGGGGGGAYRTGKGGSGGSGIVVIRNSRSADNIGLNFEYTGYYNYIDDGSGNWRIKFLTNGIFTPKEDVIIDAFLVGGGGGGGLGNSDGAGGGGGGGYTTNTTVLLKSNNNYEITIGEGGTNGNDGNPTIAFNTYAAGGMKGNKQIIGGTGGSGGGGGGSGASIPGLIGASDGASGNKNSGAGQGSSTREFGESTGFLYSGGGGGGSGWDQTGSSGGGIGGLGGGGNGGAVYSLTGACGALNTGGGGGGSSYSSSSGQTGGNGGSGIVVIRNSRKTTQIAMDFTYTGYCNYIDDGNGNWRIKFLTSGIFTANQDVIIDAFLVGGGGGGADGNDYNGGGGGGGGGGYVATGTKSVETGETYSITIGDGGGISAAGGTTSGFDLTALGGNGGSGKNGGSGGSGGGAGGNGCCNLAGSGGSNGEAGGSGVNTGGTGYGISTYEFGDTLGFLYAGGGGGGSGWDQTGSSGGGLGGNTGGGNGGFSYRIAGVTAAANTGSGGGGGGNRENGAPGGSGILIIRNKR